MAHQALGEPLGDPIPEVSLWIKQQEFRRAPLAVPPGGTKHRGALPGLGFLRDLTAMKEELSIT